MMRYRFYTCDVFTDARFGGNPLAVLPEAAGLSDRQMQQIAREFNFSESTFVLPPIAGGTRRVRIFTPHAEVPFAGHPNVGTAFVLAASGVLGPFGETLSIVFEEEAGVVPIAIERRADGSLWCELSAPEKLSLGAVAAPGIVAEAVSLAADDIRSDTHPPRVASVGLPFLIAEVRDRAALARARVRIDRLEALKDEGLVADVHLYTRTKGDFDIRARMFAPFDGVPEDPATGSANCALAGLLAHHHPDSDGSFRWRVAQGVEMGRPSTLDVRAEKRHGAVAGTWVGGSSVMVTEGSIDVD